MKKIMDKKIDVHDSLIINEEKRGHVTLPVTKEDLSTFVKSLLGRPQSIENSVYGTFEIKIDEIMQIYHLIDQRVSQQNKANLISFVAKITFDDSSSVEMNTIEELRTYNEIRPLASVAINLSWDYLILFPDKTTPEKQNIQLSIFSSSAYSQEHDFVYINRWLPDPLRRNSAINYRIEHTARTWAADIDSLLGKYLKSIIIPLTRIEKVFKKLTNSSNVILGFAIFFSVLFGAYYFSVKKINAIKSSVSQVNLNEKVDLILEQLAFGTWELYFFSVTIFLVIMAVGIIFASDWMSGFYYSKPSFLLLTKKANDLKLQQSKSLRKGIQKLLLYSMLAIIYGIAANWIFYIIFN